MGDGVPVDFSVAIGGLVKHAVTVAEVTITVPRETVLMDSGWLPLLVLQQILENTLQFLAVAALSLLSLHGGLELLSERLRPRRGEGFQLVLEDRSPLIGVAGKHLT